MAHYYYCWYCPQYMNTHVHVPIFSAPRPSPSHTRMQTGYTHFSKSLWSSAGGVVGVKFLTVELWLSVIGFMIPEEETDWNLWIFSTSSWFVQCWSRSRGAATATPGVSNNNKLKASHSVNTCSTCLFSVEEKEREREKVFLTLLTHSLTSQQQSIKV